MSYSVASIAERFRVIIEKISQSLHRVVKLRVKENTTKKLEFRPIEDVAINLFRSIGLVIQKLQSSLEDSLSVLSLALELLVTLALILLLVATLWGC